MKPRRIQIEHSLNKYWNGKFKGTIRTVGEDLKFKIACKFEVNSFTEDSVVGYNRLIASVENNIKYDTSKS